MTCERGAPDNSGLGVKFVTAVSSPNSASSVCNCRPASRQALPVKLRKSLLTVPSCATVMVRVGGLLAMKHPRNHHLVLNDLGGNLSPHTSKRCGVSQHHVVLDNLLLDLLEAGPVMPGIAFERQRAGRCVNDQANAAWQLSWDGQREIGIAGLGPVVIIGISRSNRSMTSLGHQRNCLAQQSQTGMLLDRGRVAVSDGRSQGGQFDRGGAFFNMTHEKASPSRWIA